MNANIIKAIDAYVGIEAIDPCGDAYKKICAILDAMTNKELRDIAAARIRFVSGMAKNRLITRRLAI